MEGVNYLCLSIYLCPIAFAIWGLVFIVSYAITKTYIPKRFGPKYIGVDWKISLALAALLAAIFYCVQLASTSW